MGFVPEINYLVSCCILYSEIYGDISNLHKYKYNSNKL